ncbi:CBS domain-containing protein [Ceratocystis lukuohia]|uniref:CBS domain-containing protein n=1 Tax=Ceratocystis lukuohia TaxID=2019550 RepID=A0ABR4MP39_9PEZI
MDIKPPRPKGPRSLMAMTLEVFCDNIDSLPDIPTGSNLPTRPLYLAYKEIIKTLDFLAHIVLSEGASVTESEFMQLGRMPNLAVLEFIVPWSHFERLQPDSSRLLPRVTDRMFRGMANQDNPFPALRILKLWGPHEVTPRALVDMAKFPSLVLVDLVCTTPANFDVGDSPAITAGWTREPMLKWRHLLADVSLLCHNGDDMIDDIKPAKVSAICENLGLWIFSSRNKSAPQKVYKLSPDNHGDSHVQRLPDSLKDIIRQDPPTEQCHVMDDCIEDCRSCMDDYWAALMYTSLGQANTQNKDLEKLDSTFEADQNIVYLNALGVKVPVPPKPFVTMYLGHPGRRKNRHSLKTTEVYVPKEVTGRRIYTRKYETIGKPQAAAPQPRHSRPTTHNTSPQASSQPRAHKRIRLDEMLKSFAV